MEIDRKIGSNQEEELSSEELAKSPLERALSLFDKALFNRGSYDLKGLLDDDRDKYLPMIKEKYTQYVMSHSYQEALALGVLIFGIEKNNSSLANQLGNFARRIGDVRQALSLYQSALQCKNPDNYALYNLGATLARADYYDDEALIAATQYRDKQKFILPYYLNYLPKIESSKPDLDYFKRIKTEVEKFKQEKTDGVIREMELKLEELNSETLLAKEIRRKILDIKKTFRKLQNEDYGNYFKHLLQEYRNTKGEKIICYNLCIFYLKEENLASAEEYLRKIQKNAKFKYLNLLQAICWSLRNKTEQAYDLLSDELAKDRYDRLLNLNIGLIYYKLDKEVMSAKFLILGSHLVSLSDGILDRDVFIEKAHEDFSKSRWQNAKRIYEIVIDEKINDEIVFLNYANILLKQEHHSKAVQFLNRIIQVNGALKNIAELKKEETYTELLNRGDSLFLSKKYRDAVVAYKYAMIYDKNSEIIKKILDTYQFFELGEVNKEIRKRLKVELGVVLEEEKQKKFSRDSENKDHEKQLKRNKLIESGRYHIMQKKYYNAIPPLEEAFRLQPEKNLFSQLVSLYKALKKNDELVDLAMQYKKFQEYENKQKLKRALEKREK